MFDGFACVRRSLFAIGAMFLIAATATAEPVVQHAESHIEDNGCLVFEATARVEEPIDDLFNVMARPEAIYMHSGTYGVSPRVFIGFPSSKRDLLIHRQLLVGDTSFLQNSRINHLFGEIGPSAPTLGRVRFQLVTIT
jgi:hypothetical protein